MSPHDANDRDAVSAFGIYDLPDDLLLNVINAVPVLDRGPVSGASRRLRLAAFKEGIGLYIPNLPLVAYKGQLSRLSALLAAGRSYHSFCLFLIIAHTEGNRPIELEERLRRLDELISILPATLPFLRGLVVQPYERVNSYIIAALQSRPAPQLKSLVLGSQYDTLQETIPRHLFCGIAPNLRILTIDIAPTVVLAPVDVFQRVETVTLTIHRRPEPPAWNIDIAALFPAVRFLTVRAYDKQRNTSIVLSGLEQLESLVYDACTEECFGTDDLLAADEWYRAPPLDEFSADDYWAYRIPGVLSLTRAAVGLDSQ